MYTLAYKKSNNGSLSDDTSSFKIQGNALDSMFITPVEDCVVDFGDGTKQTYTGNNKLTQVTHSYSESNIYTIKIIGNHSNFRASRNTIEIIQISNSITNCSAMFSNCSSLTTIPETLTIPNSATNCSYMFYNCSNITAIPETLTIPNSVTDCSYMFQGCRSLTAIPETFTIPNSVTNCSYMFSSCLSLTAIPETLIIPNSVTNCSSMFADCPSLTSDISNIWPSTWNSTGIIDISYMFFSCTKVVGTVPADKLWNSVKTFFSSIYCFGYCTSLYNYNEIPAGWK